MRCLIHLVRPGVHSHGENAVASFGGPTVELAVKSHNEKYPSSKIEYKTLNNGYYGSPEWDLSAHKGLDSLYLGPASSTGDSNTGTILAGPGCYNGGNQPDKEDLCGFVWRTSNDYVGLCWCYSCQRWGCAIRPLVMLSPETTVTKTNNQWVFN